MDETYIGGKQRGHKAKKKNKDVVIGVRERGGPVYLVHTKDATESISLGSRKQAHRLQCQGDHDR